MLIFRSEEHVDKWCNDGSKPRGAILLLEQCRQLAKAWYGPDRRDPKRCHKTLDEAEALFAQFGLTAPFWRLRP